MGLVISRRHLVIGLLASSALISSPSYAQLVSVAPPEYIEPDITGTDLITGNPSFELSEGSIGAGPGAISIKRIFLGDNFWADNWSGGLYKAGDLASWVVALGATSDRFTESSGTFTSTKADGDSLTRSGSNYTYQSRDGTKIDFEDPGQDGASCPGAQTNTCKLPVTITKPNGTKFRLTWLKVTKCLLSDCNAHIVYSRLSSVISSAGYRADFNYVTQDSGGAVGISPDWLKRTGVTLNNTTSPINPAPSISYTYNSPQSTTVTDPGGRTWLLTTDANGRLSTIRMPGSSVDNRVYNYNANGAVASATIDGVTTTYSRTYSDILLTVTATNPLGEQTIAFVDTSIGRSLSETVGGMATTYLYDNYGRRTRVTAPEGNYVQMTYDARGNVTEVRKVAKAGSGLADVVTTASYDLTCANPLKCNSPNRTVDERGNVYDYAYDPLSGGIATLTAPAPSAGAVRPQLRISYSGITSATGDVVRLPTGSSTCATNAACSGQAEETVTTANYNSQLLPISLTKGGGDGTTLKSSTMAYDSVGNLISLDGPLAGNADTVSYRYNSARQRVGTISPDPDGGGALKPRASRITYVNGLPSKVESGNVNSPSDADWAGFTPSVAMDIVRDTRGRETQAKLSSGAMTYRLTQIGYDSLGRVDCVAIRNNSALFASPPASACTLGTQGATGPDQISRIHYDSSGRPFRRQVALGTADQADEVTLSFSSNGAISTLTDGENNRTTFEYDGQDRLSKTRYPSVAKGALSSSDDDYEQLTYDAAGNVKTRRLRDGQTISFNYDNLNRPTFKNLPGSEPDVTFSYDNFGRVTSATQTGASLSFSYDALGRNLTQTGPQGTVTSEYDQADRRTKIIYPGAGLYVNTDYLVTGETSAIRENGATSGIGVLATFGYDQLGNRTSLTFGNGAKQSYSFDPLSRLSSLTADLSGTSDDLTIGSFTYSPAGQITGQSRSNDSYAWMGSVPVNRQYSVNGLNQFIQSGVVVPTFDARGNLTSAGNTVYGYSSENMLLTASNGYSLSYDPFLRLQQISGTSTTRFAYDGTSLLAEYDGANLLLRRYVFGPGTDEPLVQYEGSGTSTRRFLHADERGSIIAVSNSSGAIFSKNSYDEYGIPSNSNYGRFQYTGQVWLAELGMYNYKARIYSPTLGRFLQTDPVGYLDGPNRYNYAGGDPLNKADPTGLVQEMTVAGKWTCDNHPAGWNEWSDVNGSGIVDKGDVFLRTIACLDRTAEPQISAVAGGTFADIFGGSADGSQNRKDDIERCDDLQRGLQKLGRYGVKVGSEVTYSGFAISLGGVAVAGGSALLLQPEGVALGGLIAEGGQNVIYGGGIITTIGALTMLYGGSGKEAVADFAGRVGSSRIPSGPARDIVGNAIQSAVNAMPFEFRTCK